MKKLIMMLSLLLLSACGSYQLEDKHYLLGSNTYFVDSSQIQVVKAAYGIRSDDTHGVISQVVYDGNSVENLYHIEISGRINEELVIAVREQLEYITPFHDYAPKIFINSSGGYVHDGIDLGNLFNEYHARVVVTPGNTVCDSSCAIAFLGAKYRRISENTTMSVHAPYYKEDDGTVVCDTPLEGEYLIDYIYSLDAFSEAVKAKLVEDTFSICDPNDGVTYYYDDYWLQTDQI